MIQFIAGFSQNITSSEDSLIININEFTESYEITLIVANQYFESELLIQINDLKLQHQITHLLYTLILHPVF